MTVAALVRAMSDAGATPEAIAIAVEALVARDDASERRRTAERERKRRYRTRQRGGEAGQLDLGYDDARAGDAAATGQGRDGDGTGTGQGRDSDGTVPDAPPSPDKAPQTPKNNPNPADTHTHAPACEAGSGDGEGLSEAEPEAPPAPPAPPPPPPPPAPPEPPRLWSCPPGVEPAHWRDFLACRRRKQLANTEVAYARQLSLIAQFACAEWPPGRLVLASAERGWATIVDPLEHEDTGHGHAHRIHHRATPRAARRARHRDWRDGDDPGIGRTAAAALAVFGAGTDGGG